MRIWNALLSLFVWSASLVVGMGVMLPVGLLFLPFAKYPQAYAHSWLRAWARLMMLFAWLDVRLEDKERVQDLLSRQPVVIACNHQSMMDMFVLLAMVPGDFAFVAKEEIFRLPVVGFVMDRAGYIRFRRGALRGAVTALADAAAALKKGRSVLMFPEGTRSEHGSLGEFKRGTAILASQANVPILPLAIVGTGEVLRKGATLGRRHPVRLRPGSLITVPPTATSHDPPVDDVTAQLQESIRELLGETRGQ